MGWLIDQLAPVACCACGRRGEPICAGCATTVVAAPELQPPPYVDAFVSTMAYVGSGIDIVTAIKYRNHRDLLNRCGRSIATAVRTSVAAEPNAVQAVTWVPTTTERKRARGFDQAELLARSAAQELGLRALRTLTKQAQPPQTGSNRAERWAVCFDLCGTPPTSLLLIDDVRTTGSSMSSAAETLREGGVSRIVGATLAAVAAPTN